MSNINSISNKIALVAGGAGFIGSHLVERLLDLNNKVIVLDNLSSGRLENLPSNSRLLTFVKDDIRKLVLVKKLARKSDFVFHLADFIPNTDQIGAGHVIKFSMKKPFLDLDICVRGTLNVLEATKQSHAKVIFFSTAAVYGEPLENPIRETTRVDPISPYGVSKLAAETYCRLFNKMYDLPIIVARLFNVYGPRQRKYVMHDILLNLEKDSETLEILGSGNQERDFIYVNDAVDAIIFLSTKEESYGQTFNIGTGISTSIKDLVNHITKILDIKPVVTYTDFSWKGDIKALVADITKLKRMGFTPKHGLVQGIEELIRWKQNESYHHSCIARSSTNSGAKWMQGLGK